MVGVGEVPAVGDAETPVEVGSGVSGVDVAGMGVFEPLIAVCVGAGVNDSTVAVAGGVKERMAVGVEDENIGAPNSLHPKSGAAPV